MFKTEVAEDASTELSAEAIREQLELLVQDHAFRSSKRSVQFLTYVVEQTLRGSADQIKERTIGVEVFGREPSYDTNLDHVVRTAAIELRKRLAIYYGDERHRSELRMSLVPGSYIPRFTLASQVPPTSHEAEAGSESAHFPFQVHAPNGESAHAPPNHVELTVPAPRHHRGVALYAGCATVVVLLLLGVLSYNWLHPRNGQDLFWKPLLDTPGSVLLAVGDVPNGPPTSSTPEGDQGTPIPIVHKTSSPTVPFADAVTIARVLGVLESHGKKVVIRRESSSSFSDLREGPVVLIGAFNNEWSLRLTRQLRYTLALDAEKHLVYIKDAKNPVVRDWSWSTDKSPDHQGAAGGPALQDYALISRIWNSETGHVVIVIGGLYTYGTEAAGEFLTDPQLMQAIYKVAPLDNAHSNLQIVLGTTVTDETPGPPRVLAVSTE
jgi:hypothetical protein